MHGASKDGQVILAPMVRGAGGPLIPDMDGRGGTIGGMTVVPSIRSHLEMVVID